MPPRALAAVARTAPAPVRRRRGGTRRRARRTARSGWRPGQEGRRRRADPPAPHGRRRAARLAGNGPRAACQGSPRWPPGGCRRWSSSQPAAAAALAVLGGAAEPIRDLLPGATLAYLAVAGRFAADLVTRGRVLPVLVAEDEGYAARWRPVLGAADAQRARELAAAMPPLCRAAGTAQATAGAVLAETLDAFADAAARTRLQAPLLPPRRGRRPARVELAERTVAALTGPDARVEVGTAQDAAEAQSLAAALGAWLTSARLPVGPVRTCFRLVEPAETEDPEGPGEDGDRAGTGWRVEFALQSAEDPSLMLSADDVWAGEGVGWLGSDTLSGRGTPGGPRRGGPAVPRARGGTGRGGARRGRAGHRGRAAVPARRGPAAGRRGVRRALAGLGAQGAARAEADHQVDLGGDRAVGQAVRVRPHGPGGVPVRPGRRRPGAVRRGTGRTGRAQGPAGPRPRPVGRTRRSPGQGRAEVPRTRAVRHDDRRRGDPHRRPRRWRRRAADRGGRGRLARRPAVRSGRAAARAAAHPGRLPRRRCGRTRSGPGLAGVPGRPRAGRGPRRRHGPGQDGPAAGAARRERPGAVAPTLLVCPMSLVGNWQREAARFAPDLRVHVHHGAERLAGDDLAATLAGADLVLTTYGLAARDRAALAEVAWARVVWTRRRRSRTRPPGRRGGPRACPAAHRIALTGTPVENRLAELWSIMEFANPGLLGTARPFRARYAVPIERHGDEEAAAAAAAGHRAVRAAPAQDRQVDHRRPAGEARDQGLVQPHRRAGHASTRRSSTTCSAASTRQRRHRPARAGAGRDDQAQAGLQPPGPPARRRLAGCAGRSGKLARLEEICEEIARRRRPGAGVHPVRRVRRACCSRTSPARFGREVLFLHGGVDARSRATSMVGPLPGARTGPPLFLLSLKAGGTGLNLTAANHVIHVDRWWNPAVEDQATDRAFRIGQRRDVQVRKFVCVGHARGADRRDDRRRSGPWPSGSSAAARAG